MTYLYLPFYNFQGVFPLSLARISKKMHVSEPKPANLKKGTLSSEQYYCFCLLGLEFLWVLIESQEPHYDSSSVTGKAIFVGVVPNEFLFLNSSAFTNVEDGVERGSENSLSKRDTRDTKNIQMSLGILSLTTRQKRKQEIKYFLQKGG